MKVAVEGVKLTYLASLWNVKKTSDNISVANVRLNQLVLLRIVHPVNH